MSSSSITSNQSEESSRESFRSMTSTQSEDSVTSTTSNPIGELVKQITELALVTFDKIQITALTDLNVGTVEDKVDYLDVPLCRICWVDGEIDELINLPCKCQGTVGNVHAACLKEWERVRKSRRCEICKYVYLKQRDVLTVLRSFFQYRYAGVFFCKICNIAATALIAYANIVLGEMNIAYLISSEKASPNRNGLSYPVMILSAAIFPYFVINFLAVDFAMSEMIDCYQLVRDWWYNES